MNKEQLEASNTKQVDSEIELKAYYAGHVLGAAMFHIKVGNLSVVYTVNSYNLASFESCKL